MSEGKKKQKSYRQTQSYLDELAHHSHKPFVKVDSTGIPCIDCGKGACDPGKEVEGFRYKGRGDKTWGESGCGARNTYAKALVKYLKSEREKGEELAKEEKKKKKKEKKQGGRGKQEDEGGNNNEYKRYTRRYEE
mmetsp:Transcript_18807/g.40745  ORF Transcript_18807/g.40745 Transcript_18807/m.40745 type:complete len:135 (-) Transcript_18807:52-456(-)